MKTKTLGCSVLLLYLLFATGAFAQDLGPHFKKVIDGIYVYAAVLDSMMLWAIAHGFGSNISIHRAVPILLLLNRDLCTGGASGATRTDP